ncbi:hypothetical protein OS493_018588 [Desmophyllum pertusum]|uniref:Uncharacterized protein n=1 Tax=Desmophyllum pertusum TaxID=174260 RepID=A0A9W9ZND6_9CNID|nr:hypothetical protein OS493_018588 [Desmophyllum pertusum]
METNEVSVSKELSVGVLTNVMQPLLVQPAEGMMETNEESLPATPSTVRQETIWKKIENQLQWNRSWSTHTLLKAFLFEPHRCQRENDLLDSYSEKEIMNHFLKVLICITLVVLVCSGTEGKRKRPAKGNKPPSGAKKAEGENCDINGIHWGTCQTKVSCPTGPILNCGKDLHCCRQNIPHSFSDEAAISEKEYSAYLKLRDNYY